jgi:phosphohistidine phosphatase
VKKLYLVRHADAKKGLEINDIDRPLSRKGYEQAYKIAKEISADTFEKPLFITSTSIRTISTAGIFADTLNYPRAAIVFEGALYDSSYEEYIDCIIHTDDKYDTLFLFGHNPMFNQVVHMIGSSTTLTTGSSTALSTGSSTGKEAPADYMPCTVVRFEIETTHWHHVLGRQVRSSRVFSPKL